MSAPDTITIDADGWVKEAVGVYYQSHTFGPFPSPPKWGCTHGTASPDATAIDIATNWSRTPADAPNAVSTHVLIDKDGTIVQGLSLLNTSWGQSGAANSPRASFLPAGNLNFFMIGCEHVKYDSIHNSDILTTEQQKTSFLFWDAVTRFHHIPREVITISDCSKGGIIRHKDCDGLNRPFCPGPYPFQELYDYLHRRYTLTTEELNTLWSSNIPNLRLGTGLYVEWVKQAQAGNFKGCPSSPEYTLKSPKTGKATVAQNCGSNTMIWDNGAPWWL